MAGSNDQCTSRHLNIAKHFENTEYSEPFPLVVFLGSEPCLLMKAIAEKFLHDNYLPITLSRYIKDCDWGCSYIEDIHLLKDACHAMAEFYNADLVLAAIYGDDVLNINPDVIIICDGCDMGAVSNIGNNVIYSDGISPEEIYKKLITMLEE
jgi:hypothetical protein